MSNKNKNENGITGQVIVGVLIALIAGGASPWWWDKLFGGNTTQTGSSVEVSPSQSPPPVPYSPTPSSEKPDSSQPRTPSPTVSATPSPTVSATPSPTVSTTTPIVSGELITVPLNGATVPQQSTASGTAPTLKTGEALWLYVYMPGAKQYSLMETKVEGQNWTADMWIGGPGDADKGVEYPIGLIAVPADGRSYQAGKYMPSLPEESRLIVKSTVKRG
jgi:hypothetical protein